MSEQKKLTIIVKDICEPCRRDNEYDMPCICDNPPCI